MVFSDADKAIIEHFCKKGYTPYKIWKENPEKKWNRTSVHLLVKRFRELGTMKRQKGSGRPITVTTPENEAAVEDLICSQEESPGTHLSPRNIASELNISHTSVRRMVKRKGMKAFKRVKTPQMNDATRTRRVERAGYLMEKFNQNPRMIERAVFQDESDFPLQIPLNCQNDRVY